MNKCRLNKYQMRTMPNEQKYQIHPKDIPKFVPTEQTKLNRKTTKLKGTQALVLTLQHFFFVGFSEVPSYH